MGFKIKVNLKQWRQQQATERGSPLVDLRLCAAFWLEPGWLWKVTSSRGNQADCRAKQQQVRAKKATEWYCQLQGVPESAHQLRDTVKTRTCSRRRCPSPRQHCRPARCPRSCNCGCASCRLHRSQLSPPRSYTSSALTAEALCHSLNSGPAYPAAALGGVARGTRWAWSAQRRHINNK